MRELPKMNPVLVDDTAFPFYQDSVPPLDGSGGTPLLPDENRETPVSLDDFGAAGPNPSPIAQSLYAGHGNPNANSRFSARHDAPFSHSQTSTSLSTFAQGSDDKWTEFHQVIDEKGYLGTLYEPLEPEIEETSTGANIERAPLPEQVEQSLQELTGKSSEEIEEFSVIEKGYEIELEISENMQKFANEKGWDAVLSKVQEVFAHTDHPNYRVLIWGLEQGPPSLTGRMLDMLTTGKNLHADVRREMIFSSIEMDRATATPRLIELLRSVNRDDANAIYNAFDEVRTRDQETGEPVFTMDLHRQMTRIVKERKLVDEFKKQLKVTPPSVAEVAQKKQDPQYYQERILHAVHKKSRFKK